MEDITAIIIDDEIDAIEVLKFKLELTCPWINIIGYSQDPQEAIKLIRNKKPDILFLDIEFEKEKMAGFTLLEEIDHIPFQLIFTTAHEEHAIKAFRVQATDYLLKPIVREQLLAAVNKAIHNLGRDSVRDKTLSSLSKIELPTATGLIFVETKDIIYAEVFNKTTHIYFVDKSTISMNRPINSLEEKLEKTSEHFFKPHQSYLINLRHVTEWIRGDGGYLLLLNEHQVPVAKNRKTHLLKIWKTNT
ncbi:MAG: LytTR family DNA-binding domain-containing protein [Bacteroidota bacterium]